MKKFMNFKDFFSILIFFFLFLPFLTNAETMTGGGYSLSGNTSSISEGLSSGGGYSVSASAQSVGGQTSGGGYSLDSSNQDYNGSNEGVEEDSEVVSTRGTQTGSRKLINILSSKVTNVALKIVSSRSSEVTIITDSPAFVELIFVDPVTKELLFITSGELGQTHYFTLDDLDPDVDYRMFVNIQSQSSDNSRIYFFDMNLKEKVGISKESVFEEVKPDSIEDLDNFLVENGIDPADFYEKASSTINFGRDVEPEKEGMNFKNIMFLFWVFFVTIIALLFIKRIKKSGL